MNYIEVTIEIGKNLDEASGVLVAELGEAGYESFVDIENGLQAYIQVQFFDANGLNQIIQQYNSEYHLSCTSKEIPAQNWNQVWESNFEPISVQDKVYVRAPFHNQVKGYKYQIVIEPKMSFGTGHHETTSLVMECMLQENMTGKVVLDMGCGTGILGILALMQGADIVVGIDNDEWAFNNSSENFAGNNCNFNQYQLILGDCNHIPPLNYDFIIANINRNILLQDIPSYDNFLKKTGLLFLSGFYNVDFDMINSVVTSLGYSLKERKEKNNWNALVYQKL